MNPLRLPLERLAGRAKTPTRPAWGSAPASEPHMPLGVHLLHPHATDPLLGATPTTRLLTLASLESLIPAM